MKQYLLPELRVAKRLNAHPSTGHWLKSTLAGLPSTSHCPASRAAGAALHTPESQ